MKELIEKFQRMSAAQLVSKMEKGVENEKEKEIIISILQKRGRDVSPYVGKTTGEIVDEAKLDKVQKKETEKAMQQESEVNEKPTKKVSVKTEKVKKEKAVKEPKGPKGESSKKEIFYQDEVFTKDLRVKILNDSKKVPAGTQGTIVKTGYPESRPNDRFAYIKIEVDGKKTTCGRMLRFIEAI
jgi:hypothetical protein